STAEENHQQSQQPLEIVKLTRPEQTKFHSKKPKKMAATTTNDETIEVTEDQRLDKLPPLDEQYAIDDLLTEHFGFAPKVFTGRIFNIINEAIYDTVAEIEDAVIKAYYPTKSENSQETQEDESNRYPNKDDIAKSLNQLETLLCSSIDNQFDLLEIWLHRNVFNFPNLRDQMMPHFKFKHMSLWDHFYPSPGPTSNSVDGTSQSIPVENATPDWEQLKIEEEQRWKRLEKYKSDYNQSKDDYKSLLEVSKVLDRRLSGLKSVSNRLNQICSESKIVYDPETQKPIDLETQSKRILKGYQEIFKLDSKVKDLQLATNYTPTDQKHNKQAENSNEDGDEEQAIEDKATDEELSNNTITQLSQYSQAINLLVKSQTDDFLADSVHNDNPKIEVEKDEGLTEVLLNIPAKGKVVGPSTPLYKDKL
ncbi:hypothetical protein PSTT_10339, partial [Puccinia striiformis]